MAIHIDISAIAQEVGEEAAREAIKKATPQIISEMTRKVYYQISRDYYEEYEPRRYKRTYDLLNVWDVKGTADGLRISFSGEADSDMLSQHVSKSKLHDTGKKWYAFPESWERGGTNNGMPQSDWIFSNFIEGVHPGYRIISLGEDIEDKYLADYSFYGEGTDSSYDRNISIYDKNNNIEKFIKQYL